MQQTQVICPRSRKRQGSLGFSLRCWTPGPELLATHCSLSDCSAWPLNTQGGEGSMWNGVWLHSNPSTHSSPAGTKRAGRLASLHWSRQSGQMYALTSSLILQLGLDFPNTSAALLKRGPGVTGVQRDQRELIFLGPYSFIKNKQQLKKKRWEHWFNHHSSGVISHRRNYGAEHWFQEVLGCWAQMALIIWVAIDRCDGLGFCCLGQV